MKKACGERTLKVILETCLLDDNTIKNCCLCAKNAKADFEKYLELNKNAKDADDVHEKVSRPLAAKDVAIPYLLGSNWNDAVVCRLEDHCSNSFHAYYSIRIVLNLTLARVAWDEHSATTRLGCAPI